jgi:hypothetical protein
MFRKKVYGQSKVDKCPFCGKSAVTENSQGVPVCAAHKPGQLSDLKCACGEWLELRKGKWGPYFFCMRCGNISFRKGIEFNPQVEQKKQETQKKEKREMTITSEDVDLFWS